MSPSCLGSTPFIQLNRSKLTKVFNMRHKLLVFVSVHSARQISWDRKNFGSRHSTHTACAHAFNYRNCSLVRLLVGRAAAAEEFHVFHVNAAPSWLGQLYCIRKPSSCERANSRKQEQSQQGSCYLCSVTQWRPFQRKRSLSQDVRT